MRYLGWAGGLALAMVFNVVVNPDPVWLGILTGFGLSVFGYLIGRIAER